MSKLTAVLVLSAAAATAAAIKGLKTLAYRRFLVEVKAMILNSNGILYGGSVRDFIRHKHTGAAFEPNDFDVCFSRAADIDYFKDMCASRGLSVREDYTALSQRSDSTGTFPHYTFSVSSLMHKVQVEAVISRTEPPFGPCDFSCNLLVETKDCIRISESVGPEVYGVEAYGPKYDQVPSAEFKDSMRRELEMLIVNKVFYRIRAIEEFSVGPRANKVSRKIKERDNASQVRVLSNRVSKLESRGWKVKTVTWAQRLKYE